MYRKKLKIKNYKNWRGGELIYKKGECLERGRMVYIYIKNPNHFHYLYRFLNNKKEGKGGS